MTSQIEGQNKNDRNKLHSNVNAHKYELFWSFCLFVNEELFLQSFIH